MPLMLTTTTTVHKHTLTLASKYSKHAGREAGQPEHIHLQIPCPKGCSVLAHRVLLKAGHRQSSNLGASATYWNPLGENYSTTNKTSNKTPMTGYPPPEIVI